MSVVSSIPVVIEQHGQHERVNDLASRLLKERIILLNGEVNEYMAHSAVAQLLWLDSQ